MQFAVGYQFFPDGYFIDAIIERKAHISEVYFSWGDFPNRRNSQILGNGVSPWAVMEEQRQYYNYVNLCVKYIDESYAEIFLLKMGRLID